MSVPWCVLVLFGWCCISAVAAAALFKLMSFFAGMAVLAGEISLKEPCFVLYLW
jgi:hypothetical protein